MQCTNHIVLQELRGSGIRVLVGVADQDIQRLANSYSAAQDWVQKNIRSYWPDVHFRYIAVGNEVIPRDYAQYVRPAIQNLHNALSIGGLWHHIKVSTSVETSVMGVYYPPSAGAFAMNTMNFMVPIARYLSSIGAPLLANVYPYFSYIGDPINISLAYALFTSTSVVVRDGNLSYINLFDAIVDALHASLERAGAPQVPVVVLESGWPSDGDAGVASIHNAQVYNTNLTKHVLSNGGTPKRPGNPIETCIFTMFNEDLRGGAAVERHWGLFYPNKSLAYTINFM